MSAVINTVDVSFTQIKPNIANTIPLNIFFVLFVIFPCKLSIPYWLLNYSSYFIWPQSKQNNI